MKDKNISKLDIEFYLLNREYADLSVDELKIVSEHIASEQEFNEMKAALMGVGNFFKEEEELEPNPAIKTALLREFNKQQPAGSYWLNGVFVSLFPKEKKIFQKPGVQLIGLAASVMLIVTLTFNLSNDINSTELAQNDEVISEQKVIEGTGIAEKSKTIETEEEFASKNGTNKDALSKNSDENDVRTQLSQDILEEKQALKDDANKKGLSSKLKEVGSRPQLAEERELEANSGDRDAGGEINFSTVIEDSPPSPKEDFVTATEESGYFNRNDNEVASAKDFAEFKKAEQLNDDETTTTVDQLLISGSTAPTTGMVESVIVADASVDMDMEAEDLPINSRTLSEDADLIGILYTAL